MMSSTVDSSGMLMVLLMAPERNGCAAAIIFRWPRQAMERPPPAGASEQSKTGRCSGLKPGAPSMVPCAIDVRNDRGSLLRRITQMHQRLRDGVVDDLDDAAADQLLVLHQRQIGLDARGVAIHHEADGAGGRQHGDLRILVAVAFRRAPARHPKTCARPPAAAPARFPA